MIVVVAIILQVVALLNVAAEARGSGGKSNCPCLEDLPPLAKEDELIAESLGIINYTDYGVGCSSHERCSSINYTSTFRSCGDKFCYVDPLNCALVNRQSLSFPSSPRYYSSATCGYADLWVRDPVRLKGKILQGVLIDNHRGYQGTILDDVEGDDSEMYDGPGVIHNHDNKTYYGTVVDLANYIVNEAGFDFTINFTVVPEDITNHAKMHKPFIDADEDISHAACAYASGLGLVDLCLGAFTKNRHRSAISPYLEMGVTSEYLIVTSNRPESTRQMIQSIFSPFSPSLWAVTFAFLIVLSLLFAVQESPRDWWVHFKEAPISSMAHASYNALLRFWSQETFLPSDEVQDGGTWAGRFTLLAIGVQIVLTGASYTANLTNFLVRNGFESSITSIDDAIAQRKKVCVLKNRRVILETIYGDKIQNVPLDTREELLNGMDKGLCDCAIAGLEDLAEYHGRGEHCNKNKVSDPVIELPWGIPVSQMYAAPLETAISELMQKGQWSSIMKLHEPESKCPDVVVDSETESLEPKHLSGAYVLSAVLVVVGILASIIETYAKTRKRSTGAPDKLPSTLVPQVIVDSSETSSSDMKHTEDIYFAVAKLTEDMASLKEAVASNQQYGPQQNNSMDLCLKEAKNYYPVMEE